MYSFISLHDILSDVVCNVLIEKYALWRNGDGTEEHFSMELLKKLGFEVFVRFEVLDDPGFVVSKVQQYYKNI